MPHAEYDANSTMTQTPLTNGEKAHSQFISHLTSLPIVSDGIHGYRSNPYGQKSIELVFIAYDKFGKAFIPYLQGPYSYVAPYVSKADQFADQSLDKVEQRFPILKEDSEKVKTKAVDIAFFPLRLVGQGKSYVFSTYDEEYKKTGGEGILTTAKAVISTELKLTTDLLQALADFFGSKKEAAKQKSNEKLNG